jgi:two-component system, NtrC family, sensor kinase
LFTKYVALFVAVVCIALLSNGIFDVLFYYREHKASLIRIQREQAEAAAAKIGQFIKEIESQLGWTTQLPWSAGSIEQRRFDALASTISKSGRETGSDHDTAPATSCSFDHLVDPQQE